MGQSSPTLTRTDSAVDKSYTIGDSEIHSDFDNCYPWSDMQEVIDAENNVFIKIPKFYSKVTKNANGTYKHQISGVRYDGFTTLFVDGKGNMTEETPYAGLFVKKADPEVIKDLEKEGKLFDAPKFEHDYPFCWRCDTPLIYYARESWFIKMTAVRDDLVRNNKTVNWIPESIGEGRFGNWLENIQDWGISRNRYWGTPLNVWACESCGHMDAIGSREELEK